jgi:broad specificity phosphatase PhoE
MKILLMRHSEPTYAEVDERGYTGFGCDLAKLTERGIKLAEATAEKISAGDYGAGIELIVSSPYTRALQTAAIVSRVTGLKIEVETDLHEWIPDVAYRSNVGYSDLSWDEYIEKNGVRDADCLYNWEEFGSVQKRALSVLEKYRGKYQCILVVAHGGVIRSILNDNIEQIDYCQVISV